MPIEKKEVNIVNSSVKEITDKKTTKGIVYVVLGSIIYTMSVVWFFNLGNFYGGGVTGVAQIIVNFGKMFGVKFSLGILVFLINVPLFLIGFRKVSKKFAVLTIISIIVQTLATIVLENINFNPFSEPEIANNRLLLAIIGGAVAGYGASLCLKCGGSSGGVDVISNMCMMKKNTSFTKYIFLVDFVIIALAGFNYKDGDLTYTLSSGVYTLVRLVVYTIALDTFYTTYRPIKLQIITTECEKMRELMLQKIYHGITIYKAVGAYTLNEKHVLEIYASTYEVNDYIAIAQHVDPKAFITACPVTTVKGNYVKKTIV